MIVSETEQVDQGDNTTVLVDKFAFQLTPLRLDPLYIRWDESPFCPRKNFSFRAAAAELIDIENTRRRYKL